MMKSRGTGCSGKIAQMWRRGIYRVLVGKRERKRPLGKRRRRLDDSIKIDLREIGWVVWTGFIWQDSDQCKDLVNKVNEPSGFIEFSQILESLSNWRFLKTGSAPLSYFILHGPRIKYSLYC
jgi:hypothetical protein